MELLSFWFSLPGDGDEFQEIWAPLQWKEWWYSEESLIKRWQYDVFAFHIFGLKLFEPQMGVIWVAVSRVQL